LFADGGFKKKWLIADNGFAVIDLNYSLQCIKPTWFLKGLWFGFRGVVDKGMVNRLAKVELFCHTTNGEGKFTNPHFLDTGC
jgi:hypothetical protein